jgi:exoribonuclease-2
MLAPETLPLFALGFGEFGHKADLSPALSFKILLNPDLSIEETNIVPSKIRVTRLSYENADALVNARSETTEEAAGILVRLFDLAERNIERRLETGAVLIELPEARLHVHLNSDPSNPGSCENQVIIEPIPPYRSAEMVRECMILAGEGVARWALRNRVPFPFISQEAGDLPHDRLSGLAGAWQLRRSMRPRSISVKPGIHWGLGLDMYTQVTSPLRRYIDLLAHQQIRAFIMGKPLLSEDDILFRLAAADSAASVVVKAERASRAHWTAVYLRDKLDSVWEALVLDCKGNRAALIIPALGLETQVSLPVKAEHNKLVQLHCLSVKIPEGEIIFTGR